MQIDARKISARHYYDYLPSPGHRCGDIWTNLPTFGLLSKLSTSGIIVTPACDLSNSKTETVTYLPIISVREYFLTRATIPDLKRRFKGVCTSANFSSMIDWGAYEFSLPYFEKIDGEISNIKEHLAAKQRSANDIVALGRAIAILRLLRHIASGEPGEADTAELNAAYGSDLDKFIDRIIKNSQSSDLHFLPADGQPSEYSAILKHSVIMLRYPLTLPIEILDAASASTEAAWKHEKELKKRHLPAISQYSDSLPVKTLSLNSNFLSDVLSRYISMFNRLGSPDFTTPTIEKILAEVKS
jgi:hypothetical protein